MRWLLLFAACNSQPLDLPGDRVWFSSNEIVSCNGARCDEGQACCTQNWGIQGSCVAPGAAECYTLFGCDSPDDCLGGVCCMSTGRFNGSRCTLREACDDFESWVMCASDRDCPADAATCCPAGGVYHRCMDSCWF